MFNFHQWADVDENQTCWRFPCVVWWPWQTWNRLQLTQSAAVFGATTCTPRPGEVLLCAFQLSEWALIAILVLMHIICTRHTDIVHSLLCISCNRKFPFYSGKIVISVSLKCHSKRKTDVSFLFHLLVYWGTILHLTSFLLDTHWKHWWKLWLIKHILLKKFYQKKK